MAFRRDLTPINAFGITFSTVGVLLVFSSDPLHHAFVNGGPVVMVWGWVVTSVFNIVTATCLAEMAACMPAAVGSLYFFTARLAPWHSKAAATWVTAWANLLAALGTTAYYALVTMRTLKSAARLARIAASPLPYDPYDPAYGLTTGQQFAIYCAVLLSWLVMVSAPLAVTAGFITGSSLWQVFGGGALFGSLLALAPARQSAAYVLTGWVTVPRISGIHSVPYTVLVGLIFPITSLTGYETVLYFVEEMLVHRRRRRRHLNKGPTGHDAKQQQQQPLLQQQAPSAAVAGGGSVAGGTQHNLNVNTSAAYTTGTHLMSGSGLAQQGSEQRQQQQQQLRSSWASVFRQQQQQQRLQKQQQGGRGGGGGGGGWRSQSALPEALYGGLTASCLLALLLILLLLGAAPSLPRAVDPKNETLGEDPMSQIVYDILKAAYGSGRGAPGLISMMAAGTYGTGLVCTAGTSRKLWAMASDGFVPTWLSHVSVTSRVPVRAAVVATAITLLPGLCIFAGDWVIGAALSFVIVASNVSYFLPVAMRLLPASAAGYDAITRRVGLEGGFTLGRASRPFFWVASMWLVFCILMAMLPPAWPLRAATANWTPVSSALLVAVVAASWWMPRWGARRWFRGLASVGGMSYC